MATFARFGNLEAQGMQTLINDLFAGQNLVKTHQWVWYVMRQKPQFPKRLW